MTKRKIRRLYARANEAWRHGVLIAEQRPGDKDALPPMPTTPGEEYAVWMAGLLGMEYGQRQWEMTPEAWAVVLAEAQRPA